MRRLAQHNCAPDSKESLRLAVALEIHEAVPDSRLLVGLTLGEADDEIRTDIIGLVDGRKLAVVVSYGPVNGEYSTILADLRRIRVVDPEFLGLAIIVANGSGMREGMSDCRLEWHRFQVTDNPEWSRLSYSFAWVNDVSLPTELNLRCLPSHEAETPQPAGSLARALTIGPEEEDEFWS